jgi:hypothetical protein
MAEKQVNEMRYEVKVHFEDDLPDVFLTETFECSEEHFEEEVKSLKKRFDDIEIKIIG